MTEQQAFSYQVADYWLLLEPVIRAEIISAERIHPVPFAPVWCKGLVSLRGELFPVIDMHQILLNKPASNKQYLLWLQYEQFAPVVISSDALPKQIHLPAEESAGEKIPGMPGWIKRNWLIDDALYLGADHLRLFKNLSRQ